MPGHNVYAEQERALRAGITLVNDPGSAGTITWDNKQDAICEVVTAGAETRVLPAAVGYPLGQRLIVVGKTIVTSLTVTGADVSVVLYTSGDLATFIVSESGTTHAWRVVDNTRTQATLAGSKSLDIAIGNNWRAPAALITNLAGADSGSGATAILGLETGASATAASTLNVTVTNPSSQTTSARDNTSFRLPVNYLAGSDVTLAFTVTETTTCAEASIDAIVTDDDVPTTDICATAAQSIIGAAGNIYPFTITGTGLIPGDNLDVKVSIILNDGAATPEYDITRVRMLYTAA